ncbi:hypothetical protein Hanom_Chr11g00978251 [Helianthus anomalus]
MKRLEPFLGTHFTQKTYFLVLGLCFILLEDLYPYHPILYPYHHILYYIIFQ